MSPARPRIGEGENAIEPVVMSCEYDLPWNRQSSQTACGSVVQNQVGSKNWRVVIQGIITLPQLDQLNRMRNEERVVVITEETGRINVAFDNLNLTRTDENAVGDIEGVEGPLMEFQLQTKEDSESDEQGIQFFNENTRGAEYDS